MRLRRLEDGRLLRGTAKFADDLEPDGCLHVGLLRSPIASGRLAGLDVSGAQAGPGVRAVFTAADLDGTCLPLAVHLSTPGAVSPERPILAIDRVRFVGEMMAAAVADTRYRAADAVELIQAEIDPIPAIVTFEDAVAENAPFVHEAVAENLYFLGHRAYGNLEDAFERCDLVVEGEVTHPRVSAAPLEGRGVIAAPDGEGGVGVWTSTQIPHLVADAISECLQLDRAAVRVVATDVGGGFGVKAQVYPEEILLAWISMRMNAPVKWVETRSEHMRAASHARDQNVKFSAAVRKDGRVLGLRATIFSNIGAYGIRPFGPLLDPLGTAGLITGPYDIRAYEYDTYAVATNKCPEGAYRGVGMVTAVLAHERLMDLIAARLGLDPADVRRVNFVQASQMPYLSVTRHPYESGDYTAALDSALQVFDYTAARKEQARARSEGRLFGIGIGSYVEYTGAGSSTFQGRGMDDIPGTDTSRVWLAADGRVHLQTTCPAIGQGSHTTFAQVAAAGIGVAAESVVVEQTDTATVGHGTGSFMSRGSVTAATSAYRAAKLLREAILDAASYRLDQPTERLSIDGAAVLVDGEPADLTLAQLAERNDGQHVLDVSVTYDAPQASYPYATHACLVEVDRETGAAKILRYVVAEDCGVLINPSVVEGQVVGGVTQGVGAALMEEVAYGPDGQLLSGTFLDYLIPTAGEAPSVEITHLVTPSTVHELGTKGAGEGGTIGATAAVANAIADALSLNDVSLPLSPDRVAQLTRPYDPMSYLEWNARRRPHATAVWDEGEIEFGLLLEHVRRFQRVLAARGVKAGDVVGVQLPNVWQHVALELAIPDLGAVILPLPMSLGEHEMRWLGEKTRPALIVTGANLEDLLRDVSAQPASADPDPDRIVEIAMTSGTTGMPKLASLSARLKQVTFEGFTRRLEITEKDRVLPMTPLTQGIGGMCLYCLRAGAALVMLREPHWTPEHCLDVAAASRATVMVGVPTNVIRMLNHPVHPTASLRAVAVAGAPLPPEIAERWESSTLVPISSFYGSMDAGQLAVASPSDPQPLRWTTVGRPHDRAEWQIADGEICMRGDLVQDRYWGETYGPLSDDGWAHMGDLGFIDDDGYLHVAGRVKDVIIRGGTNINPYEVESMVRAHPEVIDVCVVGRPHPELGEVPVAFVVARTDLTKQDVDRFLQERGLARYKWPEVVHRVDELPLSGPGKVNRKSLRELAAQR